MLPFEARKSEEKILVFAEGEAAEQAREAGATFVGGEELIPKASLVPAEINIIWSRQLSGWGFAHSLRHIHICGAQSKADLTPPLPPPPFPYHTPLSLSLLISFIAIFRLT